MSHIHIPEKQIDLSLYKALLPSMKENKLFLEKLALFELEELFVEIDKVLKGSGEDFEIPKLMTLLKEIIKDPTHPLHSTLTQIMQEPKSLEQEMPKLLLLLITEWKTHFKEGSLPCEFIQKLLDAIHTKEIVHFTDLKM